MTENLALWNGVADIDPKYTKPITGKPYKGTSPNPHAIIKMATEWMGRAGEEWGWEITAEGWQPLGSEVHHWCRVRIWSKDKGSFEAYGQTKAAYTTRKGDQMVDEDAAKKSMTDALIKGLSYLGFAANIFLGRWDDQKYVAQVDAEYRAEEQQDAEADRISRACAWIESSPTVDEVNKRREMAAKRFGGKNPQEVEDTADNTIAKIREDEAA